MALNWRPIGRRNAVAAKSEWKLTRVRGRHRSELM
jgi:hypothetical protein